MKHRLLIASLWAASLACRPMLTIGWGEIAIVLVIIAVLLGPVLFKLYQRLAEFQAWKTTSKDKK